MKTFHLAGMPDNAVVIDDGDAVEFSLTSALGREFRFKASTDAIEVLLANFELLARKAMLRRREDEPELPFAPNPTLPPFESNADQFLVTEDESTKRRHLKIRRRGRTDILFALLPEDHDQFVKAFGSPPSKVGGRLN